MSGKNSILCLVAAISISSTLVGCSPHNSEPFIAKQKKGNASPMGGTAHPGYIKMVDLFSGKVENVPVKEVPEHNRFVYLDHGVETQEASKATEVVPIVEVDMAPLDKQGKLTSKDAAEVISIDEYGPDKRLMRHTTMVPKRPPANAR